MVTPVCRSRTIVDWHEEFTRAQWCSDGTTTGCNISFFDIFWYFQYSHRHKWMFEYSLINQFLYTVTLFILRIIYSSCTSFLFIQITLFYCILTPFSTSVFCIILFCFSTTAQEWWTHTNRSTWCSHRRFVWLPYWKKCGIKIVASSF